MSDSQKKTKKSKEIKNKEYRYDEIILENEKFGIVNAIPVFEENEYRPNEFRIECRASGYDEFSFSS